MNPWWSQQEFYCKCQFAHRRDFWGQFIPGIDPWVHVHRQEPPHACARCSECKEYRPHIPEHIGIKILLGPEISVSEAADILLGKEEKVDR